MSQSRTQEQWNHTAALLAMLANVNRDPKKGRAFRPLDFHPSQTRSAQKPLKADITLLKSVFVDSRI
jgi:hypothetical protein